MSLSRQKLTLIGIFALFLGPVILVMLMRSDWWQYQPAGMQNKGFLVQPPVRLALDRAEGISGKWVVLYVLEHPCGQTCLDHAANLRQIHTAAGRHREHLAIALLSGSPLEPGTRSALESIYPGFVVLTEPATEAWQTLDAVNSQIPGHDNVTDPVHSYVLDPMLNLVLAYRSSSNPGDIHKDLRRLLKLAEQEKKR
jgi:hypothetical protein